MIPVIRAFSIWRDTNMLMHANDANKRWCNANILMHANYANKRWCDTNILMHANYANLWLEFFVIISVYS